MRCASNNYYDVRLWVEKVIESCKTDDQFDAADNLITNFGLFGRCPIHPSYDWQDVYSLTNKLNDKRGW